MLLHKGEVSLHSIHSWAVPLIGSIAHETKHEECVGESILMLHVQYITPFVLFQTLKPTNILYGTSGQFSETDSVFC